MSRREPCRRWRKGGGRMICVVCGRRLSMCVFRDIAACVRLGGVGWLMEFAKVKKAYARALNRGRAP